jgi:hypothetical protein
MQSCLIGAPQLAEWMKQHPAERLAAWRCVIGKQDGRGVLGWKSASSREFAANPIGVFFDPDRACETFKAGKGHEELHRAIMAGQFLPSLLPPLIGLPPELQS